VTAQFRLFLAILFVSNVAGAGYSMGASWALGSPTLPVWFPLANELVAVSAALLGAQIGAAATRRFDYARAVALCSALEGASFVGGAVALALAGRSDSDVVLPLAVIGVSTLAAFFASVGAPAWTAMIYSWPDSDQSTDMRLMQESAVYQLAKSIGPLFGALLLSTLAPTQSLWVLAFLNAFTFIFVSLFFVLLARRTDFGSDIEPKNTTPGNQSGVRGVFTTPLISLILIAMSFDASRTYLPRLARAAGLSELAVGVTLAAIAAGATLAGFFGGRVIYNLSPATRVRFGVGLLLVPLFGWWSATTPWVWMACAVAGGVGLALSNAAATSWHIRLRGLAGKASAEIRVARVGSGTVGGALIATALAFAVPGLLPPIAIGISAVIVAFHRTSSTGSDAREPQDKKQGCPGKSKLDSSTDQT